MYFFSKHLTKKKKKTRYYLVCQKKQHKCCDLSNNNTTWNVSKEESKSTDTSGLFKKNKIMTSLYYYSHSVLLPLFYQYSRRWLRKPEEENLNTDTLNRINFLRESRKIGCSPSTEYSWFPCMLHIFSRTGQEGCWIAELLKNLSSLQRHSHCSQPWPHTLKSRGTTQCVLHSSLHSVHKTSYPRGRLTSKWLQRLISDMQSH